MRQRIVSILRKPLHAVRRLILGPPPAPAPAEVWVRGLAANGSSVHPSLEFIGDPAGFTCVSIGAEVGIERDVTVWVATEAGAAPRLTIGDRAFVGRSVYLGVYQPISIGSSSLIGAYSYLISANHSFARRDVPIRDQGFVGAPITIEDDVWLGTHVVVLPGVHIGRGAIVAAGSIVNRDIPPFQIWGGAPARFIKERPG